MFNLVSLIIGFVALICALVAFLPLLGWANWLIIPLAIIGAAVGMISRGTAGRNLNLFVIVIGDRPADARRRHLLSREPRIDAYIAKAQPFARPILEHVRERVHAVVPDVEEAMKWSMPAYYARRQDRPRSRPRSKRMLALNFWRGQELGDDGPRPARWASSARLTSLDDLPPDAELDALIREAAELAKSAPAPRKTKHAPKPAPEMHPEFAAALAKAPKAKAALDGFPPSAQRDYFEWIAEAKQDATRQQAHRDRHRMAQRRQAAALEVPKLLTSVTS